MVLFYLAQACGVITIFLTVSSVQFSNKEKIIFVNMLANVMCAIQYFLLSAITGGVLSIINGIRCLTFYLIKKKNKKPSIYVLILFEIISIAGGVLTWQSYWSIIPIFVSMLFTFCMWQDNVQLIRIGSGVAGIGWTAYNIIVQAYVGAFQQFCQFVSAAISFVRGKKAKKNESNKPEIESKPEGLQEAVEASESENKEQAE